MKRMLTYILITLFIITFPAYSFYCYKDKNGVTKCTDDINEVPLDQRKKMNEYTDSQSTDEDEIKTENAEEEPQTPPKKADESFDFDAKRTELSQEKQSIQEEYKALLKEDKELKAGKKKIKSKAEADKYNEKVKLLGQKFKDLEDRQKKLTQAINTYNTKVKEAEAKQDRKKDAQNSE